MQCSIVTSIPHTHLQKIKQMHLFQNKIEHIMNDRNGVTIKIRCFAKFKSQKSLLFILVATGSYWLLVLVAYIQ